MKQRAWKWMLATFGGMAAILAILFGMAYWRARAILETAKQDVAIRFASIKSRSSSRSPLLGEPLPGDAGPLYAKAIDLIDPIPETRKLGLSLDDEEDRRKLLEIVPGMDLALIQIHEAVRSARFECPYNYETGYWGVTMGSREFAGLLTYLGALAIHRRQTGRQGEALDLVLLLLQVSRDGLRFGGLNAASASARAEERAFACVREILGNHSLSAAELRRFSEALETLGKSSDGLRNALEVESAFYRQMLAKGMPDWFMQSKFGVSRWDEWRYFGSQTLLRANSVEGFDGLFNRLSQLLQAPSESQLVQIRDLTDLVERDPNWLVRLTMKWPCRTAYHDACNRREWTLMKVAIGLALYQEEKGVMPASLGDLAPRPLKSVPNCPLTGRPFDYSPGKVWTSPAILESEGQEPLRRNQDPGALTWTVKRR